MKYLALTAALLLLTGCIHTHDVQVNTVKHWEGHYMDTNAFYKATQNIQLGTNETIWVLSDRTLNNVLKNTER